MKYSKVPFLLAPIVLAVPTILLSGCANPHDKDACDGGRYQAPYYGTYADFPYYNNDYYANFQKDHFGRSDHRYDQTYGPNQLYHPSDNP